MSKRKREMRNFPSPASGQAPGGISAEGPVEKEGETDLPLSSPPPRREKEKEKETRVPAATPAAARPAGPAIAFSTAMKENLLLGALVIYVLLLALGTAGELFEVDWILGLPLFK